MTSILQSDSNVCYLCGEPAGADSLDWHHVFGGALRKKSEQYGLKVRLHHHDCHIFGHGAVHNNASVASYIKAEAQTIAMEHYGWTLEEWMEKFYKNYRDDIK